MGKEVAECSEVECSNVMLEYTNFIHVLPLKSILQRNNRTFDSEHSSTSLPIVLELID